MKKYISIVCFIALVLTSCAPDMIYRTECTEKNFEWRSGRQIAYKTNDKLDIAVNHERMTDKYSIYFLQVYNKSDSTILIDPSRFLIDNGTYRDSTFVVSSTSKCICPENQLLKIEKEEKIAEANAKTAAVVAVVAAVGVVAAAAVAESNRDESNEYNEQSYHDERDEELRRAENAETVAILLAGTTRAMIDANDASINKMNTLTGAAEFWNKDVLRITSLHSKEELRGLIVFPALKEQNNNILKLRFGKDEIPVNFMTIELDPRK